MERPRLYLRNEWVDEELSDLIWKLNEVPFLKTRTSSCYGHIKGGYFNEEGNFVKPVDRNDPLDLGVMDYEEIIRKCEESEDIAQSLGIKSYLSRLRFEVNLWKNNQVAISQPHVWFNLFMDDPETKLFITNLEESFKEDPIFYFKTGGNFPNAPNDFAIGVLNYSFSTDKDSVRTVIDGENNKYGIFPREIGLQKYSQIPLFWNKLEELINPDVVEGSFQQPWPPNPQEDPNSLQNISRTLNEVYQTRKQLEMERKNEGFKP